MVWFDGTEYQRCLPLDEISCPERLEEAGGKKSRLGMGEEFEKVGGLDAGE